MKHIALVATLFAVAFAASAQTSPPATSPAPVEAAASNTDAVVDTSASKDAASERGCLKETGSRITPTPDRKGRKCINASGRAYDRKDIDRTGAIDLKDALRRLDPAVN